MTQGFTRDDSNPAPTNTGWVFLAAQTASSSATLNFSSNIDSTYNCYVFILNHVLPANDGVDLYMRTSTNAGVSYDSGANDYFTSHQFGADSTGSAQIEAVEINGVGNAANEGCDGIIYMINPSEAKYTTFIGNVSCINAGAGLESDYIAAFRAAAADVDAVQFFFSAGNIASGTISMYGACTPL